MKYPAIFFEDGDYIGVEFPDLPGCFSQGKNLDDAKSNAAKALGKFLGEVNFYPAPAEFANAELIEPVADEDDTHTLLVNPATRRRVVFPQNQEILGDKLSTKIQKAAGLS